MRQVRIGRKTILNRSNKNVKAFRKFSSENERRNTKSEDSPVHSLNGKISLEHWVAFVGLLQLSEIRQTTLKSESSDSFYCYDSPSPVVVTAH
ncbi:hypothetical protein CEXT_19531 [Caerostris extrusa]|uniref:Uncharacterized protein n=1 Tax=Caerostris extrusa TaxID=172846 RepID=A0AAV4VNZ9_CAEEX|nr:hypothetical protein CEXT_19531 [Caerostris extrusa]